MTTIPDSEIGELVERLRTQARDRSEMSRAADAYPVPPRSFAEWAAADTILTLTAELSAAQAMEARMRGLLYASMKAMGDMLTGISVHNALSRDARARDIKGAVVDALADTHHAVRLSLSDPCATDEGDGK